MTGKPEVPQTGGSQLTSRPRHAAPQALQLRGPRRTAGGGGGGRPRPSRSGRGKGGGSGESRAGKLRRAAVRRGGGANGLRWLRPPRPPRGGAAETRRPAAQGRRAPGRGATGSFVAATEGLRLPRPRQLWLSYRTLCAFTFRWQFKRAPSTARTRVHARSACFARCVHTWRAPAESPHAARQSCGPTCPGPASRLCDPASGASFSSSSLVTPPRARKCVAGRKAPPFGPGRRTARQFRKKTFHHSLVR